MAIEEGIPLNLKQSDFKAVPRGTTPKVGWLCSWGGSFKLYDNSLGGPFRINKVDRSFHFNRHGIKDSYSIENNVESLFWMKTKKPTVII